MPRRKILVVEAGKEVDEKDLVPGYTKPRFARSDGNWMYETVPQKELNGRKIPYPRCRGMGGCSGNNFMAWVRGPSVDYDDWAEAVGDEWWKRGNVLPYMKKAHRRSFLIIRKWLAKVSSRTSDQQYLSEKNNMPSQHPSSIPREGKLIPDTLTLHNELTYSLLLRTFAVGYGTEWQPLMDYCIETGKEAGHSIKLDNNDGDPIGLSIAQLSVDNGARMTSASAFLSTKGRSKLSNVTVVTQTMASKVLFEGTRVSGVRLISTKAIDTDTSVNVYAAEEIIVTAGVGPARHLNDLGIPVILNLPAVGQNIQDHSAFACEFIIKPTMPGHNQLLNNPMALEQAVERYAKDKTGPLSIFGASASIIFPKLPKLLASPEFAALPPETQDLMNAHLRPSTEIWMHSGPLFYAGPCPPAASVLVLEGLCQNNLSRGSLELKSRDPRELPAIDPGYMTHPYDFRIAVETLREIIKLAQTPTFSSIIESILLGPRARDDDSKLPSILGEDDDILEAFIKDTLTQGFHSMGTCVMGRDEETNKVVGTDFKIDGLTGLRIADMSICLILTSNHTQINAYLIGERCAELVI